MMSDESIISSSPSEKDWKKIQLLALDVDGVMTDGTVFVGPDGLEIKQFSILDGLFEKSWS